MPSTENGGLWYTLEDDEYPTLWVKRKWVKGSASFAFDFGYNYDMIAYKGPSTDGLYSYWLWRPNFSGDIYHRNWTTTVPAPVVEKTDHGVYALRNLNTALTNTTSQGKTNGWSLTQSINFPLTVDFWLSWNADTPIPSNDVVGVGDTYHQIFSLNCTESYNYQACAIAVYNTNLYVLSYQTNYTVRHAIEGYKGFIETSNAGRIHIAITATSGSNINAYVNGKFIISVKPGHGNLKAQIFPYMVGTETEYRPLYIDHLRIWNKVALTNDKGDDFEPPKEEDYIIW